MATLNLSTNGHSISKSYQSVVDAPAPAGATAESGTYGQWAVFTVSAPLVSAFQDASGKESVLKVHSTGEGELIDLIEEFSEGKIQFAYVKVKDPNTSLPKNVLIAWCGEGVPERTKGYFTSHLAAVSKFLHGYHVQITARSDRDLTPEGIIQKVADSSGAKYSTATVPPSITTASKPPVASKPAFTPTRTGSFRPLSGTHRTGGTRQEDVDADGWGADAPPVTRTQLEKVQSAYQPTKVNMKELMSQKPSTAFSSRPESSNHEVSSDVVKGDYQPTKRVDIAEIRRKAREAGELKDDRPEPVKGAYEPVGKVDIAAIRAKSHGGEPARSPPSRISPAVTGDSIGNDERKSLAERSAAFTSSERLMALPKPKVAKKFGGSSTFTGTKAPLPGGFDVTPSPVAPIVGSASRTFADVGGKTPAQLWAEKKAKQSGVVSSPPPMNSPPPLQSQASGEGGWKSSYTGKTWAPVQVTHTGRSSGAAISEQRTGERELESETPETGKVGSIRDRFANTQPMGAAAPTSIYERAAPSPPPLATETKPTPVRAVPIPGLSTENRERHDDIHQDVPPPAPQRRSPTPETPADIQPGSPIRVAMPIGRGSTAEHVTDAHEELFSTPAPLPIRSMVEHAPREEELEAEPAHDPARAVAQATAAGHTPSTTGHEIRALVQYDYEKAEDNEIELREGEYVTNIDMVDEDWWLGVNARGDQGLFPRNYVEVIEDSGTGHQQTAGNTASHHTELEPSQPTAAPSFKSHGPTATALYDYEAAEDNEIGFPEGAKIINIEFPDEDWWHGEYNGKGGLFPANYVQLDE
ncbi:actin binding protein [Emydomyces testavorans]|uniref:Actin binding protein n=1 Tax=Emydomyces testavorans TaxID=2070801 RepID=A0AAF0IL60_9EURO|nr:actin binding protein [Emydomyces testavorans]